ncbi:MAG: hypothetical protein HYY09_00935 [Firmicutes bacterium]|nr:hypothetical protein [Bacillota bacterium]
MTTEPRKVSLQECESLIQQIRDVISARVVADEHGGIQEIHVLAEINRSPKQIVRDIETTFMVNYGWSIDHKKISVVQLETKEHGPAPKRMVIETINFTISGAHSEVKVILRLGETVREGNASGAGARSNHARLIATATLDAAEKFLEGNVLLVVEDITALHFAGKQVALVCVAVVGASGEESLLGAAFSRQDDKEGIVRATLDAINRRYSLFN